MHVLKFGGSSLDRPERMRAVGRIVARAPAPRIVVVSALGGVTDALTEAADLAARGGSAPDEIVDRLEARHTEAVAELAADREREGILSAVRQLLAEVRDLLRGAALVHECSVRTRDRILSYGERLSSTIVAAALRAGGTKATACDARDFVVTDDTFGAARVDPSTTYDLVRTHLADPPDTQVVTGFVGAGPGGVTTTLGRGGSDLTAALIGAALRADRVEIWTDVDGLMSADPRLVPEAFSIDAVSYHELMELSHFGAKVIYPPTVHPARELAIPIVIRNTLNPAFPGTVISVDGAAPSVTVRGVSSIGPVALLRLEGDGMVGVPGIAARLFGVLARSEISVILISQASSEHSICFAVEPVAAREARMRVDAEFDLERRAGLIDPLIVEEDFAVVAVVGEGMRERAGIAGKIFSVLGEEGVNVRAIAQGSSERSISLVVRAGDERAAVRAIHHAFFSAHVSV